MRKLKYPFGPWTQVKLKKKVCGGRNYSLKHLSNAALIPTLCHNCQMKKYKVEQHNWVGFLGKRDFYGVRTMMSTS